MSGLLFRFDGTLEIKPKNVTNWIDYSSHIISGNLDKRYDTVGALGISIADPEKLLHTSVGVGFDVRLKLGFDGESDNWLFRGYVAPQGITFTDMGITIRCYDFLSQLVRERILLTEPDAGLEDINHNIVFSENYDGDECFNSVTNVVESLENSPLTVAGKGTWPQKVIEPEDGIYSDWNTFDGFMLRI